MDVFDLVAKIRLDSSEYESGIGKAKGTLSSLASGVKTGLSTMAKVGGAAIAAGAAGVAALTKMGVEGYAQYEQLTGGVETLFKESGNAVMKYAENAYKTSGLSANAYMETVTSFSASLIQSLDGDTAKAAKVADMAITDMSDNANKMGTSIDMIQNAYNGFAKGNYTMLDNLKLGYGGTKEEMQRLLKEAEKISGIKYDISSFSDISEAIHVIQQDMEISGISYEEAMARVASGELTLKEATELMGTTAKEAASTIEGSIGMMKASWENLVVGMADSNADMGVLIDNFAQSTAIAAENILPKVSQALSGIGEVITGLAPIISEALPMLVEEVLPSLLSAGVSLVTAIVKGIVASLPALYTALLEAVQIILVEVFGVSEEKAGEFADGINSFFTSIKDGFVALVESAQTEGTILNRIWTGLQTAFEIVKDILVAAFDAVSEAFTWCAEQINTEGTWLNSTWNGIKKAVQALFDYISALFDKISEAFTWCVEQINTEGTILNTIWDTIKEVASTVWENIKVIISTAIDVITGIFQYGTALLKGDWSAAWEAIKGIVSSVWEAIKTVFTNQINAISNIASNVWNSIKSFTSSIWDGIKNAISNAWDSITSKVSNAIERVKSAISAGLNAAKSVVSSVLNGIKDNFSSIFESAKNIVSKAIDKIKSLFNFSLKLDMKLPHVTVHGGKAPWGIGGKGKLPSFDVEWYKKAYDNAMVLSNPTIFGYSNGKFLGGGDGSGNEIVAGESHLMNMIGQIVESRTTAQNERVVSVLTAILEAITDGNEETIRAILSDKTFAVGEREFARLVRTYA